MSVHTPHGQGVGIQGEQDEYSTSFIRALDIGGLVWEGKNRYSTIDEAFQDDMETGLTEWTE